MQSEKATLFLVFWPDWQDDIQEILNKKDDGVALIVYAPPDPNTGQIPRDKTALLDSYRNTILVNFRGRLLNDIVASMITTSYK